MGVQPCTCGNFITQITYACSNDPIGACVPDGIGGCFIVTARYEFNESCPDRYRVDIDIYAQCGECY